MPELPEVETIVRDLRPLLVGRRIASVERISDLELRRPWNAGWPVLLTGRRIEAVNRRGKWIVLHLDDSDFLVVHLGMTGQFTVVDASTPRPSHLHLVFALEDGQSQLRFRDIRRFGSVTRLAGSAELQALFIENGMGPEPFDLEAKAWQRALAATTRPIKSVLLDQTVVAGVGNIYADEALHVACLHPTRRSCDLTRAEADRLRKSIAKVLTTAIEKRGSTIRDYVGGSGLAGGYQDEFRVYGRKGDPCPRCKTPIASLRLGGRSSHYCPQCQPAGVHPESAKAVTQDKPPSRRTPRQPRKAATGKLKADR